MKKYLLPWMLLLIYASINAQSSLTNNYFRDIKQYGEEPVQFVNKYLSKYDLLIFDDALHSAYEPFAFYNNLITDPAVSKNINFIFLEVIGTTSQPLIDSFLKNGTSDSTILIKIFQDDYTGMGWRYQTYLDLFKRVWQHNKGLADSQQIKIVAVNPPVYWEAIHSKQDYELFQNTLKSRDYFMYLEISERMEDFVGQKKGIFLCNTRHAYNNVKNLNGDLYWNTATFFRQRNPGKTASIRIHNVALSIERKQKTSSDESEISYKWTEMNNGTWDSAFALNLNRPVALSLKNTFFGRTNYIGNHMLNVEKGTTMADAYDALIFLAPLKQLHFSAKMSYLYTAQFQFELKRRLKLLEGSNYENYLKQNNAENFEEFYKNNFKYTPITENRLMKE